MLDIYTILAILCPLGFGLLTISATAGVILEREWRLLFLPAYTAVGCIFLGYVANGLYIWSARPEGLLANIFLAALVAIAIITLLLGGCSFLHLLACGVNWVCGRTQARRDRVALANMAVATHIEVASLLRAGFIHQRVASSCCATLRTVNFMLNRGYTNQGIACAVHDVGLRLHVGRQLRTEAIGRHNLMCSG